MDMAHRRQLCNHRSPLNGTAKHRCRQTKLKSRHVSKIKRFADWGTPTIVLFAVVESTKGQNYASKYQLFSQGNAVSLNWLITFVINRCRTSKMYVILIAPVWGRQPWFLHLMKMPRGQLKNLELTRRSIPKCVAVVKKSRRPATCKCHTSIWLGQCITVKTILCNT